MRARLRARLRPVRSSKKRTVTLTRPPYAARHSGETALVLGTGPSLRQHGDALHALIEDERPVVLGGNHITPFVTPDYHAFTNRKRFIQYAHTIDRHRSRVILSPYIPEDVVRSHYNGPYEELAFVNDSDAPFGIRDGIVLSSCRGVAVLLVAVAAVMGAERILVAGIDGYRTVVGDGSTDETSMYYAPTNVLRADPADYVRVSEEMGRHLGQIQEYLVTEGREPFAILTETAYEEHYRPALLRPYE